MAGGSPSAPFCPHPTPCVMALELMCAMSLAHSQSEFLPQGSALRTKRLGWGEKRYARLPSTDIPVRVPRQTATASRIPLL